MSEKPTPPEDRQAVDRPYADEVFAWLTSEPVRQLTHGRVHRITPVGVRWYQGIAYLDGRGYRHIRLNIGTRPSMADLALTLCHELAHYDEDALSGHTAQWREAFAELVREAGRLGLFTDEELITALDTALHGPAGAGLDWREQRAEREQHKRDHDNAALTPLLAAGLQVGSSVAFTYHGERVVAEVVRINRRTVSALSPDGKMRYRLSFSLVELVQ